VTLAIYGVARQYSIIIFSGTAGITDMTVKIYNDAQELEAEGVCTGTGGGIYTSVLITLDSLGDKLAVFESVVYGLRLSQSVKVVQAVAAS